MTLVSLYHRIARHLLDVAQSAKPSRGRLGFHEDSVYAIAVTGAPGYVHVRVDRGGAEHPTAALNMGCPLLPDYPVLLYLAENTQIAVPDAARLPAYYAALGDIPFSAVGQHSHEPELGNFDWVSGIRIKPGIAYVESGLTLRLLPFWYVKDDDTLARCAGGVEDMSSYFPATGEQCWGVIGATRSTGALAVRTTAPVSVDTELTADALAGLDLDDFEPRMAVKLRDGATGFTFQDFEDPRLWGTKGGGGSASGFPVFGAGVVVTLDASGVAAAGDNRHLILAANSGTADDLIEVSGLAVGDEAIVRVDSGDTIMLKHNDAGATDKLFLPTGADFAVSGSQTLKLVKVAAGIVVAYLSIADAASIAYNPTDPTDWSPLPSTPAAGLDTLADVVKALQGGGGSTQNYAVRIYSARTFF